MANVTSFNLKNFYQGILKSENPLYKYQFIGEFIGLKDEWGISDSSDASKNITYYIQSANIPGVELTTGQTTYLGTMFRTPGVMKFSHSWTCNILLEENLNAYKGFRRWQEHISSLYNDGGGNKAIPNVTMNLSVLSSDSKTKVQAIVLEGVWCKSVGQIQVKYTDGGGQPIKSFPIELRYQYNYSDPNFDRKSDPFGA